MFRYARLVFGCYGIGKFSKMCFMLSRLTDKAAGGTSPVTQRVEATENIPWWAMMSVVQDLTQAICHVRDAGGKED